MDLLPELMTPSMALASGLSLAAGAYLNAKLSVSTDLSAIYQDMSWGKRLGERIQELGDTATVYKMLERVVDVHGAGSADALWFEKKTWSYSQLKDCMFCPLPFDNVY